jgi:hypothetical protein
MHYLTPTKETAHVVIFYRDFKSYGGDYEDYNSEGGKCHRGLGVNALHTAKVLRKAGVRCDIAPVWNIDSVRKALQKYMPTHAIVEAFWIKAPDMSTLLTEFPSVHFVVRCHSQIGFLQVEPGAIKILRDMLLLQEVQLNLTVSANTLRLKQFIDRTYKSRCLLLPNLYNVDRENRKPGVSHDHRSLRIGCFGAHRLLKNHTTSAAAALMMANRRGSDLEFYVNSGRTENPQSKSIMLALNNMFNNLRWAKIVQVPWEEWSQFRLTVSHMDLVVQASFTETFNIVTADAVSEGVPAVVGPAIEWVPESWQADPDDADDIARVGSALLWDTGSAAEGLCALEKYVSEGLCKWLKYLDSNPT